MNWSNPVIIGLLVFIAFLVVGTMVSAIAAFVLSGRYKKWKTKTTTPATSTKSSGWFWKLVIIGVIGFGIFGVVRYFKTPKKIVDQTVVTPRSVTEKKWRYGCLKSDKVKGLDPTQRNNLFRAKITYYGGSFHEKARIDFEVYLPQSQVTVYYHSDGTFEQLSPPFQKGNWWLSPVPSTDTNPIFFQGFERYPNGEEVSIWLRAID